MCPKSAISWGVAVVSIDLLKLLVKDIFFVSLAGNHPDVSDPLIEVGSIKMTFPQVHKGKGAIRIRARSIVVEDIWKEENKFSLDIKRVLNKTPKCNIKARIQSQYIIT